MKCNKLFNLIGFNVETVEYKNISFTVWDVGGQDKVRSHLILQSLYKMQCMTFLLILPRSFFKT